MRNIEKNHYYFTVRMTRWNNWKLRNHVNIRIAFYSDFFDRLSLEMKIYN